MIFIVHIQNHDTMLIRLQDASSTDNLTTTVGQIVDSPTASSPNDCSPNHC